MATNLKKEITIVTDIGSLGGDQASIAAVSDNSNFNKYFKIEAWVNAIAAPACKSYSHLVNTVTAEGVPVLIMLSPNNPAAGNVFTRLFAELAEFVILNIQHTIFMLDDGSACLKPTLILSHLPAGKPEYVNFNDASPSLYVTANVPGGFYIETVTDGAYLHIPGAHGAEAWPGTEDGLVLECYSARDMCNTRVSKILLTSESVSGITYVPEKQLKYLYDTLELFEHVGKGNYDLLTLFSSRYEDVTVPTPVSFQEQHEPMQRYYGPNPMTSDPIPGTQTYYNSQGPQAHYADPESVWPHDRAITVWNTLRNSVETVHVPKGISINEHLRGCPDLSIMTSHVKPTNVSYKPQY